MNRTNSRSLLPSTSVKLSFFHVITVVNREGIRLPDNGIVFEPLASAEACLTAEERDLGVALVDIGAASSGLAVYCQRAVEHTAVIAVGGDISQRTLR